MPDAPKSQSPGATGSDSQRPPAFLDAQRPPVPDLVVPRGVQPFVLPGRPVRGRLVRLGALADALLTRHDNEDCVTRLAGEALALAALLSSALKFRGSFSLQAKGDGPLSMLLADATDAGALRGYARAEPTRLQALLDDDAAPSAHDLLGEGYLAFTVDAGGPAERHQGIVAIEGDTLSDMALHYFRTSEQLRCTIRLACERTPAGWRASALFLERVATTGGIDPGQENEAPQVIEALEDEAPGYEAPGYEAPQAMQDHPDPDDAWHTATTLAATVTDAELLDDNLPPDRLLWRLFGMEGVALHLPRALAYGCRCSRQRLAGVLERFGHDDLDHMAIDGAIVMTCEFCNLDFRFDRQEVGGETASPSPDAD